MRRPFRSNAMPSSRTAACSILTIAAIALSFARGEDAKDVFTSLYGPRLKQVAGTIDKADDLALAKDMLAVAKTSTQTPDLLALLCEASYDLATKQADGFGLAAEAMTLLAEQVEAKKPAAREKLVGVLTKQSRIGKAEDRDKAGEALIDILVATGNDHAAAGNWKEAIAEHRRALAIASPKKSPRIAEVREHLDEAVRRDRLEQQIAILQEKLLKDANDSATAEELVTLHIAALDDPAGAQRFLNRVKDPRIKALAPMTILAMNEVGEADCLKLGEWYRDLAKDAAGRAKAATLGRSIEYLERYISLHTTTDVQLAKAKVLLSEVMKEHAAMASAGVTPAKPVAVKGASTTDVLKGIDVTLRTEWTSSKGSIIVSAEDATTINSRVKATGSYLLRVRFTRVAGDGHGAVAIPCGKSYAWIVLDCARGNGRGSGLRTIKGKDYPVNPTHVPVGRVKNGEAALLEVRVELRGEEVTIDSTLDGKSFIRWSGLQSDLTVPFGGWAMNDPQTFGFGAYQATMEYHTAEVRELPDDNLEGKGIVGTWTRHNDGWHVVLTISQRGDEWAASAVLNRDGAEAGAWSATNVRYKSGVLTGSQNWIKKPVASWKEGSELEWSINAGELVETWRNGKMNGRSQYVRSK